MIDNSATEICHKAAQDQEHTTSRGRRRREGSSTELSYGVAQTRSGSRVGRITGGKRVCGDKSHCCGCHWLAEYQVTDCKLWELSWQNLKQRECGGWGEEGESWC